MANKTKAKPAAEQLEKSKKPMLPIMEKGGAPKMGPPQKAAPDAEGDDEDGDEGDEEIEKSETGAGAAELSEDDLQKSLDRLADLADAGNPVSRKETLLKKSLGGEELEKSERDELFKLMGGESVEPVEPALSETIEKSFTDNEVLQKSVDVSDYLDENQKALIKSLATLSEHIEKSDSRQHEFNLVLAKAFSGVGKLVKSMSERLGVIESQPARGPKSKGIQPQGRVLEKSFGGQKPQGDQLSHNQILDGLEGMMQKSMADGREGRASCGENIAIAVGKFEQTREISRPLLGEVTQFVRGSNNH